MDKKLKERGLKAANSTPVKADMWLWLKIISAMMLVIVGSLVLTPGISEHVDGWHHSTQIAVTAVITFGVYLFIKRITR